MFASEVMNELAAHLTDKQAWMSTLCPADANPRGPRLFLETAAEGK